MNFANFDSTVGGRGGGRGHDALIGASVKIRLGHYKGCKGRVKDVKGSTVRIELESQMKVVAGKFLLLSKMIFLPSYFFRVFYLMVALALCS